MAAGPVPAVEAVLAAGPVPELDTLGVVVRVAAAGLLGGLVGLERELKNRPAGFRTHILVSLGACLFTMAGAYGIAPFYVADVAGEVDPTRVAAQVVAGIGFLGAGAIIRTGASVQGLTTAAALWVTAAVGLAVGLGYWSAALATTIVTVAALMGLKRVERGALQRLGEGRHRYVVEARDALTVGELAAAVEEAGEGGGRIDAIHMEGDADGNRRIDLVILLPSGTDPARLTRLLHDVEGVVTVSWESPS